MKVTIENYRGFDIYFDTDYEVFQCIVADESAKESKSYTSVKKFVDDYKKDNQDFKPFWVYPNPDDGYVNKEKLRVIGLRKDGRFIAERKGERVQISDYDLKRYVLEDIDNERFFVLLNQLSSEIERQRLENIEARKKILSGMKLTTLADYKKTLLS